MTTEVMALPATEDKDLQLVTGAVELFHQVPDEARRHKASLAKAAQASKALIDKIGAEGNQIRNAELDEQAKEMILKIKKTITTREEARKGITQIFTAISKIFTGVEAEIKELIAPLQVYRDDYAKWLHEEAERKKKEAEKKAAIETAKADLKAWIQQTISGLLNDYLFKKKQQWTKSFNETTLENYHEKAAKLPNVSHTFNRSKLGEILQYTITKPALLDDVAITEVKAAAHTEYDFDKWIAGHDLEMLELKTSLIDRLASKKAELDAAAKAEADRKAAEAAAAKAEAERQAAIAKANAADKDRLEKEAAEARKAEAERVAAAKAEADKAAADKAQREKDEADRLALEKSEADRKAREDAERNAAAAKAQTLFDQAIEASPDGPAVETRNGFEIKVLHHAGWAEIFQLWYTNEGVKMPIDDLGKKSLNQMKTWAEGHAKKTGEKISSKYISYETSVKAVNRK
jgi:hypothetical protein